MNIYDIAKAAGVSIATVSRVINNKGKVSEKTRRRVTDVINQNSYVPGAVSRRRKSGGRTGVICSARNHELILPLLRSLEKINIVPEVIFCDDDRLSLKKSLDLFRDMHVDAIIMDGHNLAGQEESRTAIIRDCASQIPIIMLGAYMDCQGLFCITCPEQTLVSELTLSYIKRGISDIVFLFSSMNYGCTEILQSYKSAFTTGGLPDAHDNAHLCPAGFDDAYSYIADLISVQKIPRLIIASDDELAAGALKATVSAGISVPGQTEIIGTGNTSISRYCQPELSTIDCHTDKICGQAAFTLSALMHGCAVPTRTVFSPTLIKKGTTL